MIEKDKWYSVKERCRTYLAGTGVVAQYFDVKELRVSSAGYHYLTHDSGKAIIAPNSWTRIEIVGDWIDGGANAV